MKIVNVTPGLIPIPPNGWGAVEKIIWENHQNLLKLGHDSYITYLDSVPKDADIVHIHVANLALMARDRGIPYYFTTHDHHAYLNGKDSFVYKENLEAMKYAVKSFVPAKYLVDYFEGIPQYLSHGVNTEYFTPVTRTNHKLLCVANNGYAHDQTIDRKGFGIAIEAARALNLPLTIAGPSNNKNYFNKYPPSYDKLTILYDLSEEQLLTVYKDHSIFLHPSELEAGHPNLTLLEALACGLPIVGTFESKNGLDGMVVTSRDTTDIVLGIQEILLRYEQFSAQARRQAEKLSWMNQAKELITLYQQPKSMRDELLKHYKNTKPLRKPSITKYNYNNIDGMFAEIVGGPDVKYDVQFINDTTGNTVFSVELSRNSWAKPNTKYFVNWRVRIQNKSTKEVTEYKLDLANKKVFICFESKSLGDTLAWIPYVEEFRKKHNCKVVCATFWNQLFVDTYPNIEFVSPGTTEHNIIALYRLGLFYKDEQLDYDAHPTNPIEGPLQKIASDILGLEFREIRPKMKQPKIKNDNSKQIVIAPHSSAQTKYWNNPTGWQEVVDWLIAQGYTVKNLSQEHDGFMGNKNPIGITQFPPSPIEDVIAEIAKSKMFIGISSGLSWVSWAAGIPTVMISGFTDPINEMRDCIRISAPQGKCTGCWHRYKFNPGDWNWCPDHKGTTRQFECSREITGKMVIDELEKLLTSDTNSYAGPSKQFTMIDVVNNNFNNQLVTTDEAFWNGIYADNKYGWWGAKSKSGEGSEGAIAEYKKNIINGILDKYSIDSILDFGCGDFNWMKDVRGLFKYVGIDIVRNLIEEHNKKYVSEVHSFIYGNIANTKFHLDFIKQHGTDFDMGILFDILGHQLWDEIEASLDLILNKLNLKYLLVSNEKNCYNPNYWKEKNTRNQSIDIEIHPLMIQKGFTAVEHFENGLTLYKLG